jgi:hypothetical protein
MQIMKKQLLPTLLTCLMTISLSALAEEGGSGHYSPGEMASFIDALPGYPTIAVMNIFTYYGGDVGHDRTLPLGGNLAAGVNAHAYMDTVAMFYESPFRLLGGNYAAGIALPFGSMTVEGDVTFTGPLGGNRSGQVKETSSGSGDVELFPFLLGWTNEADMKYDFRLGIYAPSGQYEKGSIANLGKNYWTFEPTVTFSWLSSKIGTEVSLFAGVDFNTINDATDYRTGTQFHLDGTIAQHLPFLGGFIGVGANGFYYQQITGDSGSGNLLGDFEGRTVGVGPVLSYIRKIGEHSLVAEVKWLPELDTQNRLQGDWVWFKLAFAF